MDNLREALEQSYDEHSESAEQQEPDTEQVVEDTEQPEDETSTLEDDSTEEQSDEVERVEPRVGRDERGRFKSKSAVQDASPPAAEPQNDQDALDTISKRPGSFRDTQLWEKVSKGSASPEEQRNLAKYYVERESQFLKGVGQYKEQAEKSHYLARRLEPYVASLQSQNIDPGEFVENLAATHNQLMRSDPQRKAEIFHRLAADYGVVLQSGENGSRFGPMDQHTQMLHQQLQDYGRELSQLKQWREQEIDSSMQGEISRFANDRDNFPYFEELRLDMAQLLESGHSTNIEDAYKKAVRLNDDVWAREQQRQLASKRSTSNPSQIAKARAIAVSPRSSSPVGASGSSKSKSLRASLEDAFSNYD